ncbi:uncharacterized protein LOC126746362 [Anthonomus grandis grandis]|uniref:uncharacterized protein LOC126746362 n=1 Tax=Anthonomus grandis grandis TaxID=2921223 RepID=UPI0021654ECF|nr:uncharacterized protein LOC126746362 [Anthonomus grandis grandis]
MSKIRSKRSEKQVKQQNFLRKIKDMKDSLFGQFSTTLTKETKRSAWMEVRDYAVSIGLITCEKDYTYVRDATWPNIRNRTMIKLDNAKKTGSDGGPNSKLDDTDKLVIEIIGKNSPVIEGIGVADSMEEEVVTQTLPTNTETLPDVTEIKEDVGNTFEDVVSPPLKSQKLTRGCLKRKIIVQNSNETKYLEDLKRKKLELEVRKLELEVWDKERSLNVSHCNLTSHIEEQKDTQNITEYILNEEGDVIGINEKL